MSDAVVRIRQSKLPTPKIGNAGSFFKNPTVSEEVAERLLQDSPDMPHYPQPNGQVKLAAGWLIEQADGKVTTEQRMVSMTVKPSYWCTLGEPQAKSCGRWPKTSWNPCTTSLGCNWSLKSIKSEGRRADGVECQYSTHGWYGGRESRRRATSQKYFTLNSCEPAVLNAPRRFKVMS